MGNLTAETILGTSMGSMTGPCGVRSPESRGMQRAFHDTYAQTPSTLPHHPNTFQFHCEWHTPGRTRARPKLTSQPEGSALCCLRQLIPSPINKPAIPLETQVRENLERTKPRALIVASWASTGTIDRARPASPIRWIRGGTFPTRPGCHR